MKKISMEYRYYISSAELTPDSFPQLSGALGD